MRILLLPLDERPCNLKFPQMLAQSAGITCVTPSLRILGRKKVEADIQAISLFVSENMPLVDAAIVSLDTYLYGGLIPSRLHHRTIASLKNQLLQLKSIREQNPQVQLYAFMSVMRAPAYDSSDEEPDYYASWGKALFRRAFLMDKLAMTQRLSTQERQELSGYSIPQEVLDDYENRRNINLALNLEVLHLVKDGVINFLVLPQDDSSEFGYTAVAQRRIHEEIHNLHLDDKVLSYPGSDEVGMTLLARSIADSYNCHPRIVAHYASANGPKIIPRYEDRPMAQSLKSHVTAVGAQLDDDQSEGQSEGMLFINCPGKVMQEAQYSLTDLDESYNTERSLNDFVRDIELISENHAIAICDSAFSNGGDLALIKELDERQLLSRVVSYAGWNTNCNTLGTTLAQMVLELTTEQVDRAQLLANLAYRVIEDAFYQTLVRWNCEELANQLGGTYFDIHTCEAQIEAFARQRLQEEYNLLNLSQKVRVTVNAVHFPWHRLFEIDMDITVSSEYGTSRIPLTPDWEQHQLHYAEKK